MAKHLSGEMRTKIEIMLRQGHTGYEIAYATGVSESTICKIRKKLQEQGWESLWHPVRGGFVSSGIY